MQRYELHIDYDPIQGASIADGLIEKYIDKVVEHVCNPDAQSDYFLSTSSELVITEIRVRVKQKQLDPDLTCIYYKGEGINILPNGRIDYWPEGFCNVWDRQLDKLLDI